MEGSIVLARWRQCALPCGHTGATCRIWLNLCFLQPTRVTTQTANRSVLHSSRQILNNGRLFPPKLPLRTVESGPPCNTITWAHSSPQTKWYRHRFSHFCTDDRRVSLYFTMGHPFPPQKLHLPMGDLDPI